MESLKAIRIQQRGITSYVTSLNMQQVKRLRENGQLEIETFDPNQPIGRQGYQRKLDTDKITQIARFVSRSLDEPGVDVLMPILPSALVLNCREGAGARLRFNPDTADLTLPDRAVLYVVDGQHRIEGVRQSEHQDDYDIPTVILDGLGIVQEAAQFLTINSKQTRVRPDLQLRVLYNFDPANTRRLVDILKVEDWKLEAQALVIALNDSNESPWRNLIRRPNDTIPGWKPMREAGFIDTLKTLSDPRGPLRWVRTEEKTRFLIEYWDSVRRLYEDAFSEETGRQYHVCRTFGAGVFNALAASMFHIHKLFPRRSVLDLLRPVSRKWPLRNWARRTGIFSREAARQSSYILWGNKFSKVMEPRLNVTDERVLRALQRRSLSPADQKTLAKAERTLQPVHMRTFDSQRAQESGQRGCYVLLRLGGPQAHCYIGKGENIGERLVQHNEYHLYGYQVVANDREVDTLEMALFHLLAPAARGNDNHPPPQENCPYC